MHIFNKLAAGSAIVAAVALGSTGLALADGYTKGKMALERPTDWSGVYFGVSSGYQWSSIDVQNPAFPPGFTFDHAEGIVGAHLGLQHQFGHMVLGIEGGWASSFRDDEGTSACFAPGPQLTPGGVGDCAAKFNDVLTIGGRVGFAAGHWMPYVTGGYANAAFDFTGRAAGTGILNEKAHARLNGWYVGIGGEWHVSPGWTAGIEYRHYDFGDNTVAAHTPAGVFLENALFEATTETITARVSWRWGREAAAPKPLK